MLVDGELDGEIDPDFEAKILVDAVMLLEGVSEDEPEVERLEERDEEEVAEAVLVVEGEAVVVVDTAAVLDGLELGDDVPEREMEAVMEDETEMVGVEDKETEEVTEGVGTAKY